MTLCRAGRGADLPAKAWCPHEATRPALRRTSGRLWCDEHAEALRRVAVALGNLPPDLDELRAHVVAAASKPLTKAQLAIAADTKPNRKGYLDALAAAVEHGEVVTYDRGNTVLYARPEVDAPPATFEQAKAQQRRSVAQRVRELVDLIDEHGPMTRAQVAERMGWSTSSVGNYAARALEDGALYADRDVLTRVHPLNALVAMLRERGPMRRAELADALGISLSTLGLRLRAARKSGRIAPLYGHGPIKLAE